jgi:ribosomal-protein-alanine N-acetyltransferase
VTRVGLPIETERLLIRPLVASDAEELHGLYSDPDAMQYLETELPSSVDESRGWVRTKIDRFERDDGMSLWALVERESGAVIGDVGLQWEDYDGVVVDLGCRLVARYWGRGYAAEASRAVLDAGFRELPVDRICAATHVGNERAHRVLTVLGAVRLRDIHVYGMDMTLYEFARP